MVGFKLARLAPVALIFMLCLSALAAGACAVAEDAGGGAPSAEPLSAKLFLTLDEGDLPFDALTLWSAQRFLDGFGIIGRTFIRSELQDDFAEFIPDASLDAGNDILMLELLFDNTGASALEFELNGDDGQFALLLNATTTSETSAVYPTAWIEVTSPATEDGDISFINPRADDPLDVVHHARADDKLTLAPNAMERVWLTFEIAPEFEERPVALRYQPASGDAVEFALID